jgi:hypothetical protein
MGLFNFFSKKPTYQPSDYLLNHSLKDKYFYRTMPFRVIGKGQIAAFDDDSPSVITFDPWPQIIFLEATGNRTIGEFINDMANGYKWEIPAELDRNIISELERMIQKKFIEISDLAIELDERLIMPIK